MGSIVSILLDQQPNKIGHHERDCVQESLANAVYLLAQDFAIQNERNGKFVFWQVVELIFGKKKQYYRGLPKNVGWSTSHMQSGLPEVRLQMIRKFRQKGGFVALAKYIQNNQKRMTASPDAFLPLNFLLTGAADTLHRAYVAKADGTEQLEDDSITFGRAIMSWLIQWTDEDLKAVSVDLMVLLQRGLLYLYERLIVTRREATHEFHAFWRNISLKLITRPSLPLKLYGWEVINEMITNVASHRPPPRAFIVSGAGSAFCNGRYEYAGQTTKDGYVAPGQDVSYVRTIPDGEPQGGHKLTIFRCTMRSQQKWWFLSEADEEQPGTDRDIDYYQHKSKEHEEGSPPPGGWLTCRSAGSDPPPTLRSDGLMVPEGKEYATLEHELAKWAIENRIVEQVLGDSTIHREIVARSTSLIQFLAQIRPRQPPGSPHALQAEHLLYAWKTCTRKADAAVAQQVYNLLVSVLPVCPPDLAIPLLNAVQDSLSESDSHLVEVGDFCAALAAIDKKDPPLLEEVREEVLTMLWAVLTHPEARSLKSYDSIKRYVTFELSRSDGKEHRERFLQACIAALSKSADAVNASLDEDRALRMIKLTHFLLEACPREQADAVALRNNCALPRLVYAELVSFLKRKKTNRRPVPQICLQERLRVLRHVYGLSEVSNDVADPLVMSLEMVHALWELCVDNHDDREAFMMFIASACNAATLDDGQHQVSNKGNSGIQKVSSVLSPVFTDAVFRGVFVGILCSVQLDYAQLGPNGYTSFQELFKSLRHSNHASAEDNRTALDVLWRICLTAAGDAVANTAMADLLRVYIPSPQVMQDDLEDDFGERMFRYLGHVKVGLQDKSNSARDQQSAQRCLRILNSAIAQQLPGGYSMTRSTLNRLSRLAHTDTLDSAVKCLPHGMRGTAAYMKVGVVARRPQPQQGNGGMSPPQQGRFHSMSRFPLNVHPLETLLSVKTKVALSCQYDNPSAVRLIQITGRSTTRAEAVAGQHGQLTAVPDDFVMDELGVVHGCEIVFAIAERNTNVAPAPVARSPRISQVGDLSRVFYEENNFSDKLFETVLDILELLPGRDPEILSDAGDATASTHQLAWDLLMAMPTNVQLASKVRATCGLQLGSESMELDSFGGFSWSQLLEAEHFNKSIYVLLTVDAYLQPAVESMSILPPVQRVSLEEQLRADSVKFHKAFVDSGGLAAVVRFFSTADDDDSHKSETRMADAVALRILKCCLYADTEKNNPDSATGGEPQIVGAELLNSLANTEGLLKSLTMMVVDDPGVSSFTILDVLRFLGLLLKNEKSVSTFVRLPGDTTKRFLTAVLSWDDDSDYTRTRSSVNASLQVRAVARDLILTTPILASNALVWLIDAIDSIDPKSESSSELFSTIESLVTGRQETGFERNAMNADLQRLVDVTCRKVAACPRPTSESDVVELSSGVLCGCLSLLRALIDISGGDLLNSGVNALIGETGVERWSSFAGKLKASQACLIDLMGVILQGFLTPLETSSISICFDKESRHHGFAVVASAAKQTEEGIGYHIIVDRIGRLISSCSPTLRHRWNQFGNATSSLSRSNRGSSKYSGLRNQGCTCYMNSALQQLFMMKELRNSLLSAPIPDKVRTSGVVSASSGTDLVGKKISLQWDSGVYHEAIVEGYDDDTKMHTIRYCPVVVATVSGAHNPVTPEDIAKLPPVLVDEFILSEGRLGKETGVFEIVPEQGATTNSDAMEEVAGSSSADAGSLKETKDEADSRHLLEEVQRTFTHLDEGSKGRCFDPRALVEASACLKLEFDVWQQNDASEFVLKLLDRLEIALKRYAPRHFAHMDHTFGLKQTQQKICKQCGLKTNREEKLLSIDCQIRGKSDVHEALSAMTAADVMEGSNRVFCDRCKEKTDTILRNAISTLPNMLILSLKRFDLDFTTFETVKLNSRCAFGQTLNMKPYTLEGVEAMEKINETRSTDPAPMDTDDHGAEISDDPLNALPDEDYEYRLAGVLVHAGVAQGGHYYSFIRDRSGTGDKWYRFEDEEVTPFNPSQIETECFGGKVKKEQKFSNGQVHTVETEQYANALMLWYEKVKPNEFPEDETGDKLAEIQSLASSTGYDVFKPDVQRSNATHRWQSFLFDGEFRCFLKAHLDLCRPSSQILTNSRIPWKPKMVSMLLSYLLDVMAYSADRSGLFDWTIALRDIMLSDSDIARSFVHSLASKTLKTSSNWLRTFLLDCPDRTTREAVAEVFAASVESTLALQEERDLVDAWTAAWDETMRKVDQAQQERNVVTAFPIFLSGSGQKLEDPRLVGSDASAIGIIISTCSSLLDYMPRCWRFSGELCWFIRALSTIKDSGDEYVLRRSLIVSNVPGRLIALAIRDRPNILSPAFPGASVPTDVAATQIRAETSHTSHVMAIGSNQMMGASEMNNPRGATHHDFLCLLEALLAIAGLPGIVHADLYFETEDTTRGRTRTQLTEQAVNALSIIFREKCDPNTRSMGRREIDEYLRWSGEELSAESQQKIAELISRYPVAGGAGTLGFEAYLAYYRESVQNTDKLQQVLHTAGFRPDLSRRSQSARFETLSSGKRERKPQESVAFDVAETLKSAVEIGKLATEAFSKSYHLVATAFEVNEIVGEYLVAASVHMRDPESLINQALLTIHRSPNDWTGNAAVTVASHALTVIASMPGDDQMSRILLIMQSSVRPGGRHDYGVGLLSVLRSLQRSRPTQHYNTEVHWGYERYISVLRELALVHPVLVWMQENKEKWSFVERDLSSLGDHAAPQAQHFHPQFHYQRNDLGARDPDGSLHPDHHSNTDSDMGGMNDSDDEDEGSQYDNVGHSYVRANEGPFQIVIESCGTPGVNGVYQQDGVFETACKYVKQGLWKGRTHKFSIFQCHVSNNTRHWYISIVPHGNPGTSADIDFYTAPVTADSLKIPPTTGWTKAQEGMDPAPIVSYQQDDPGQPGGQENDGVLSGRDMDEERSSVQQDIV